MKNSNKTKTIGQKIKLRRQQLSITQTHLAKAIGVQKQRITELENTSKRPSAEMLFKISQALDAPILYFLTNCKLNDVDEEVLSVKFRELTLEKKKLAIEIIKLMAEHDSQNN